MRVDGLSESNYAGYAIEVNGAKNALIRDNIVELAPANPIRTSRCNSV